MVCVCTSLPSYAWRFAEYSLWPFGAATRLRHVLYIRVTQIPLRFIEVNMEILELARLKFREIEGTTTLLNKKYHFGFMSRLKN